MRDEGTKTRSLRRVTAVVAVLALVAVACDPGKVTPIAGTGAAGTSGDGGPATAATFQSPGGIAAIPGGGYYVVDDTACVIRKVDAAGTITTVAGTGTCGYSGDGGPATSAQIHPAIWDPSDSGSGQLAIDPGGNLYLADSGNRRVRKIDPSGVITSLTPNSLVPSAVTVAADGTVYIAFEQDSNLQALGESGELDKVLGDGTLQTVVDQDVFALAAAPGGDVYFSTASWSASSDTVEVLHPDGSTSEYAHASARVTNLTVGSDGTVYGAQGNYETFTLAGYGGYLSTSTFSTNRIMRYGPGTETPIAGTGQPDPGSGAQTGYGMDMDVTPEGLAVGADGALLFSSGHVVSKLDDPATAQPWSGPSCNPNAIHPGVDLSNQDLTGIDLHRCDLSGVNLTNTALTGAELDRAHGTGIIGTPASLPTGYAVVGGVLAGPGTDYTGANLDGIDLSGTNLAGATFSGAHLWGTNFTGANLTGATFEASDLHQTDFHGADLTGANIADNVVNDDGVRTADFSDANLTNFNPDHPASLSLVAPVFTGANVEGADLTAVKQLASDPTLTSGGVTGTPTLPDLRMVLAKGYLIASHADLTDADLTGADLTGADLSSTTLTGADLSGATLTNVKSGSITGTPAALPADWTLTDGYLIGPGANLRYADLSGADLTGTTLTGADLYSAILTGANLGGVDLSGVDLTGSRVRSGSITGTPSALPANWDLVDGYLIGPGAYLSDADLSGADLTGTDLTGSYLNGADLSGATLTGVTSGSITGTPAALPAGWVLAKGYLVGPGINLAGTDLSGADLTGTDLTGTDLTGADLSSTTLTGADLSGATLTNVKSGSITGTPAALPANWTLTNGYLIGPGADLRYADLTGATLTGVDLTNANLTNATLTGVRSGSISGTPAAMPDHWKLIGGYLIGPGADLTGADLSGADLTGVRTGSITGTPSALPVNWALVDGYLVGPGADLFYADLNGADLSGVDLNGAYLFGAHLTLANLSYADLTNTILSYAILDHATMNHATVTGATFTNADLTRLRAGAVVGTPAALPTGWALRGGFLVGPDAYAVGFNLTGVDLSNLDLTGASLAYSNLTNADLTGTTLAGTTLTSANFTGATGTPAGGASATYSATTCPDTTVATTPATCVGHGFAS